MRHTGYSLALSICQKVIVVSDASDCQYDPVRRAVILPRSVAMGSNAHSLMVAAHEAAHDQQPRWIFWLRWLEPARWWCEMDAWRRAERLLR